MFRFVGRLNNFFTAGKILKIFELENKLEYKNFLKNDFS
jgi:hypothetical protein